MYHMNQITGGNKVKRAGQQQSAHLYHRITAGLKALQDYFAYSLILHIGKQVERGNAVSSSSRDLYVLYPKVGFRTSIMTIYKS